uniref:Castor zinc finger 1 n=1 Tax=Cyprinus carpio carpio TaxID=630221 RepID=A0A9J7ZFF7_CYPCA
MAQPLSRSLCTEKTSGKSTMAAKRKGGLKLNAICAKLSKQVVYDGSSQNAEGDSDLVDNSERGSLHYDEGDRPESDFPEGLTLGQSLEEDQKRREAIEKWVNGEYADDPQSLDGGEHRGLKPNNGDDCPPEGVYMVQPKGCSDEEDNAEEADTMPGSHEGSYHEDRDSEGSPHKDDSYQPTTEAPPRQAPFSSPGEASALRDYAANTMNEFLHMFGYDDKQGRDELARKISFEKLKAATSDPSSLSSEEATRRARFSKYEEYIRKLKAGETLPWPMHTKPEELNSKMEKNTALIQPALTGSEGQIFPPGMDHKQSSLNPAPTNPSHIQNLASRASKYDYFIQKLKMGESLRQQNGNSYKRPSKYDLENVKFLHLFKPGEGNPDMGGAIAFKTGKVGRPSKYDIRNIQKLIPGKVDPPMMPSVLPATAGTPGTPVINTAAPAGVVGPPGTVDQAGHLGFNTDHMKSSFSKTDSITTGTVSSVKNGLPPEKPATEDVNVYQKYIARFSGSQHCGHVHCAYQYREHYHCMDPECNYQRFTSKQDVIRHYNMHKKRDNSLQHGFMRFSPLDDCSVYYHGCHLNGKSTHYHCMQVGCNKVYTSTSDVMTHENFHKKNAQLINDGFQRFRATEDCGTVGCQFYGQKTTHFHCRRPGCTFTFKNKCDIEKHKSYHIKDDAYAKDGFKKFYKYEECKYEGCVYSKATNHFHCIRQGCGFTFTSTSQMTSHKRKHERRHIRSSGVLGLTSPFLLPKEELEESSNDDLMDYSAISSKNSSLSASPTTQQSSTMPHMLPTPTTTMSSSHSVKPTTALPPASRISTLLSQALPSNVPMALALSNSALAGASNPFFPLIPRMPMSLTPSTAGLISAATSGGHSMPSDSLPQTSTPTGDPAAATVASTPTSFAASSIMEKMSASKGLISPMMARLAAAALKPSSNLDAGMGQPAQAGRFNPVEVKQEPVDGAPSASQESIQEHSLDLSKKDHRYPIILPLSARAQTRPAVIYLSNNAVFKESNDSAPNQMAVPISMAKTPPMEVPSLAASGGYSSSPSLQAWKQLAGSIPQLPASMPSMPATSPLATTSLENAKPQVKPGFLQFQENDPCLATDCKYSNKFHFHCLFGNCKYVCKTSGKAESHCLDHINPNNNLVNVRDQFSYYSLQCLCPNQHCEFRMRGHYHCLRPGCFFVTNITTKLPWHVKKHEKAERRAANGFKYFTKREECGRLGCKYNQVNSHFHCIREGCQFSFLLKHQMTSHARKHMRRMLGSHPSLTPNFSSMMDENDDYMDYTGGGSPLGLSSESSNQDRSCTSTPVGNDSSPAGNTISIPTATGAKKRFWIIEDMSPFGKRRKTASSRKMLDEGMMLEGFRRYDLYEDCKDTGCQFSLKVTHYHCTRENCGYKFCGRTHMYKHAQHHDRVDNLVLDDFKRFKSSLCCNFPDCQFSGNSTHFHCLRCGFRCTDSTKVTAHRKHHGKQDVISAAGFCQFSSSVDCEVADCKYKLKCSHFHCTYPECKHTVVGMSQMDSHKRKHEKQERGELPSVSPNQDGNHHHHHAGLAVPPMPMNMPPTSPGTPGLTHKNMAMYLHSAGATSEYEHPGLDSSLNLGTDTNSSLFFLKNAAGLGLSDSMDLSKKMYREPLSLATSSGPAASMGLSHPQDDTTGTSGDPEDDLSAEEEPIAEEDDDDDDDEEEEDMNTDSYEDSMPEPEVEKDNGESFDASMNHAETSQLDKEEPEAEP